MAGETTLEMCRRHVRRGEAILSRQQEIISRLEDGGHDTTDARSLMTVLSEIQAGHVAHLMQLLAAGG